MQQFFIEDIKHLQLSKDQLRQCRQVLRMKKGDCIRLVDIKQKGVVACFKNDDLSELEIVNEISFKEKKHQTTLVMALIRNKNLEWLLQKTTELGVDRILLYPAEHGVVTSYGNKTERKEERFQDIVKEAAEQSYRSKIPEVKILNDISEAMDIPCDLRLVADVNDHPFVLNFVSEEDKDVQIIVGPEGGFSDDERIFFKSKDCQFVSLSSNILRAETAGMIAVHLLEMGQIDAGY